MKSAEPDVVCLQELKCVDEAFPRGEVEALGYNVATHGQKAYNGVAILSKRPLEDVRRGLPGDEATSRRAISKASSPRATGVVRVASIYLPNGNPIGTPKFDYKLAWMDRLTPMRATPGARGAAGPVRRLQRHPRAEDAADPGRLGERRAVPAREPGEASARCSISASTDAVRACNDQPGLYTFWDYQAGAFQRNNGIRIDHLLLSPQAQDKLKTASIRKEMRGWDKPSDHVPVHGRPQAHRAVERSELILRVRAWMYCSSRSSASLRSLSLGRREGLVVELRRSTVLGGSAASRASVSHIRPLRPLARNAVAGHQQMPEQRLRGVMALLGREIEPARGLTRILLDARAFEVEAREVVLRVRSR